MPNPTPLALVKALDACATEAPTPAHGATARHVHPSERPMLHEAKTPQDLEFTPAERDVIATLTALRQSNTRNREAMLNQIRGLYADTRRGFAFVALSTDGVLVPLTADNAEFVDARTRMQLHCFREERMDEAARAAEKLATMTADWAEDLLHALLPALSDSEFDMWARPGQVTMVGFVSADGSIFGWDEYGQVIRPSLSMTRNCGIDLA